MMTNKISWLALVVALIALAIVGARPAMQNGGASAKHETAFERVMRTGTLRCGYVVYPPYIMKDLTTTKLSGIYYDYTNALGELAGLKVDWSLETNYTTFTEELSNDRFDVFCGGLWPDTSQAKVLSYSIPTNYSGIGVYVRADDSRFDKDVSILNDPKYKFAAIDGDTSQIILRSDFPNAIPLSMPSITDITALAENVKDHKADATIIGEVVANEYMAANPNALKNVYKNRPIRVYENVYAFPSNSPQLVTLFNVAIKELLYSGVIDRITTKYAKKSNDFYPAALPYAPAKQE